FVLATGGILGGGISTNHLGYAQEMVFGLPVDSPEKRADWLRREFLHPQGHPIFRAGIDADENFRSGYDNLFVVGGALGGGDFVRERSLEGVGLVTGYVVGEEIARE
ncbi:MAG: glycerol-3-phosphate dehydrogenase subunit GlpB, partial [Chloroflexi bacterium]|nr:glycerol-3-phosphate dehydrogenase subunit GlpB [Chloroflexota bacterium]